jgi:hypothetical protein
MTLSTELGGIFGQNLDEFKSGLNPVARVIQVSRFRASGDTPEKTGTLA